MNTGFNLPSSSDVEIIHRIIASEPKTQKSVAVGSIKRPLCLNFKGNKVPGCSYPVCPSLRLHAWLNRDMLKEFRSWFRFTCNRDDWVRDGPPCPPSQLWVPYSQRVDAVLFSIDLLRHRINNWSQAGNSNGNVAQHCYLVGNVIGCTLYGFLGCICCVVICQSGGCAACTRALSCLTDQGIRMLENVNFHLNYPGVLVGGLRY